MATTTPRLGLTKPGTSDQALIGVIDANFDILDNAVTLTSVDTQINKTLTSPVLVTPSVTGDMTLTTGNLSLTAGNIALGGGSTPNVGIETLNLHLGGNATQATIIARAIGGSDGITEITGVYTAPQTAAVAFTCAQMNGVHVTDGAKGAASVITTHVGVNVDAQTLGATNIGVSIVGPNNGTVSNIGLNMSAATGTGAATIRALGNIVLGSAALLNGNTGNNVVLGDPSLANGATDGFPYIPSGGGAPSGTPTAYTGMVPIRFNTADNKLYAFLGGAWRSSAAFAP